MDAGGEKFVASGEKLAASSKKFVEGNEKFIAGGQWPKGAFLRDVQTKQLFLEIWPA